MKPSHQCIAIGGIKLKTQLQVKILSIILRERPFNLKGGGYGFFLKKYSDSQCCWKKYSDFGRGKKKKCDSDFLSYNLIMLMLNFGGKNLRFARQKKKNILTLVLSEKKILNETKNHNPPLQVKWSVPYWVYNWLKLLLLTSVWSSNVNDLIPARTIFLAISAPSPLSPISNTLEFLNLNRNKDLIDLVG